VQKEDRPCCQTWGCKFCFENCIQKPRLIGKFSNLLGPKLGKLPDKLQTVVLDAVNETSIRVHVRVPKEIDGRSGYFKVFFSEGLE